MNNHQKVDIITSLDNMSYQVGQVITEYHWRELQSIRLSLQEEWKIEDHYVNDHINIMTIKGDKEEY